MLNLQHPYEVNAEVSLSTNPDRLRGRSSWGRFQYGIDEDGWLHLALWVPYLSIELESLMGAWVGKGADRLKSFTWGHYYWPET